MNIQWYPGHMAKTRRLITENLKLVDLVVEVIDARIPISSRNPDLDQLAAGKPRLVVLARADLADPAQTDRWIAHYKHQGLAALAADCKRGAGLQNFDARVRAQLSEKLERYREKGQAGRGVRAMVVGIPNSGKSSLINRLTGRRTAKAEDRPGVTRGKQWVGVSPGFMLLDMPGILWPSFEDPVTGLHLAFTGAIRDETLDLETLACHLMSNLAQNYPELLAGRYKLETPLEQDGYELLQAAARKRGFLISGGECDTERMARILLDEFRGGVVGRMTLERLEDLRRETSEGEG